MVMHARVLNVESGRLLVCDLSKSQEVIVNTPNANCFRIGDHIRIEYSGIMTMSIPPQITATNISKRSCR